MDSKAVELGNWEEETGKWGEAIQGCILSLSPLWTTGVQSCGDCLQQWCGGHQGIVCRGESLPTGCCTSLVRGESLPTDWVTPSLLIPLHLRFCSCAEWLKEFLPTHWAEHKGYVVLWRCCQTACRHKLWLQQQPEPKGWAQRMRGGNNSYRAFLRCQEPGK